MKSKLTVIGLVLLAMVLLSSFAWAGPKITKLSDAEKKFSGCYQALMDLEGSAELLKYSVQGFQKLLTKSESKAKTAGHKGMRFNKKDSGKWRKKKDGVKKAIKTYQKKCKGITAMLKGGLKFN